MSGRTQMTDANTSASTSYLLEEPERFRRETARLRLQAEKLFHFEMPSLINHGIAKAQNLLELGCGNGGFLLEISKAYPNCQCAGADRNESLLSQARLASPAVRFHCVNLADKLKLADVITGERPDYLAARYVLQHMAPSEYASMLSTIRMNKLSKARLLLMDTDDRLVRITPHCPALSELLRRKNEKQLKEHGDRTVGGRLADLLRASGFQSIVESSVEFSSAKIGWDDWDAIFWPVISAAVINSKSDDDAELIRNARKWLRSARTSEHHYASFTIKHASGI